MRLTARSDDYGYEHYRSLVDGGKKIRVFLDDVEQKHVVVADEETGYVIRAVLDSDGLLQIDPEKHDCVWEETVKGTVRIEIE